MILADLSASNGSTGARSYIGSWSGRAVIITVKRLPEGCYLATSEMIPGLFVECATAAEARDTARELAPILLTEDRRHRFDPTRLNFINVS